MPIAEWIVSINEPSEFDWTIVTLHPNSIGYLANGIIDIREGKCSIHFRFTGSKQD